MSTTTKRTPAKASKSTAPKVETLRDESITLPAWVTATKVADPKAAKSFVGKAARLYRDAVDKGAGATVTAAYATGHAMRTGYLRDGRGAAEGVSVSGAEYAASFGVAASTVTLWKTLALMLDKGVDPTSGVFRAVAFRNASGSDVRKAIKDGADADGIRATVAKTHDPETGRKVAARGPAKADRKGDDKATAPSLDALTDGAVTLSNVRKFVDLVAVRVSTLAPRMTPATRQGIREVLVGAVAALDAAESAAQGKGKRTA